MIATQAGIELESCNYHRDSETYRFEYDLDATPPSMAVVAALSEVMDTDPTALKPLHDTIDAGALDSLIRIRDAANEDVQIEFFLENHAITVYGDGVVAVAPPDYDRTDDQNHDQTESAQHG